MLMREAAKELGWKLNFGGIALMWRGGCIIRRYGRIEDLRRAVLLRGQVWVGMESTVIGITAIMILSFWTDRSWKMSRDMTKPTK